MVHNLIAALRDIYRPLPGWDRTPARKATAKLEAFAWKSATGKVRDISALKSTARPSPKSIGAERNSISRAGLNKIASRWTARNGDDAANRERL